MDISAGYLSFDENCVYFGLKESILKKDNDMFVTGSKKLIIQLRLTG
jgi:hypothetical protein